MLEVFQTLWKTCLSIAIISCIILTIAVTYLESNLPSVEILKDVQLQVPLKIYSSDGKLIAEYGEKRLTPLTLNEIPQQLINAVIATEDRRFYQHPGIDIRGLARAVISLITKGTKEQGGSTITMQVARNFFLTRKKTYTRKINEILLALKIEQELSKDEIMELYLNKIYLGKRSYGVAAAAEVYYGANIADLTLAQMAVIAGLPQAPSAINPLNSPESAMKRRSHVLDRMLTYNFISQAEYNSAMQEPISAKYHGRIIELEAPYVAEMIRQQLVDTYGQNIYEAGYEVITTIDSNLQTAANHAVSESLIEYDRRHGYRKHITKFTFSRKHSAEQELKYWLETLQSIPKINSLQPSVVTALDQQSAWLLLQTGQHIEIPWDGLSWATPKLKNGKLGPKPKIAADILSVGDVVYTYQQSKHWVLAQIPEVEGALVALNPNNGSILALVGGFNYEQSRFNRATQAERQPGSSFKPFIYGAAIENGFTAASIINDAPIVQSDPGSENDWRPQNYTKNFYGPTRLRTGITHSRNLVSIRLLKSLGIDKALHFIQQCGIKDDTLTKGLSLALGTNHLTPLELANAYSVFPNGGYKITSNLIHKVIDFQGNTIYTEPHKTSTIRAISPQTAYIVTSMLQDVIQSGTSRKAKKLGRNDLAGKTGTTNDQMDGWYAGYNKDIVATTWIGFDEPKSLKEYAVKSALPIWIKFMEQALQDKPENSQPQPDGLTTVRIDPTTGLLARSGQTDAIYEIFTTETVPTETAPNDNGFGYNEGPVNVENIF